MSVSSSSSFNEARFRSLFENSLDAILLATPDGVILAANPAACELFGMSEEELKKAGRAGVVVLDERAKLALKERDQTGKARAELTFKRKDGSTFEGEISASFFADADGVVKTSVIIRDITKRKKTENTLKGSEERLKMAQQIARMGSWEYYVKEDKAIWSEELFNIFKLKPQPYGPNINAYINLIHPEDRKKVWQETHQFNRKVGETASYDYRIILADGSVRTIHSESVVRDVDECGIPQKIMGIEQDITERKKTEEQLAQYTTNLEKIVEQRASQLALERERFFNMLEDLPVMVCLITPDYQVPYANRLFREKFGESAGQPCYMYCGAQNAPCSMCESMVPLKTGKPHHWVAHFPNGMYVEAWDFPFTDVDGKKMILEVDVDITERVNMQKQLQDKERMAAVGETAGMVGHDLRNPLQSIVSELYLAKSELRTMPESEKKKEMTEAVDSISEQVSYMDKIVSDLQTFVKPVEPLMQIVKLKPLITSLLAQQIIPNNIQTTVQVPDKLNVEADPQLLKRVLINLITNAVQAMPQGGELTITAQTNNTGQAQIEIKDTGTGIPEEIKPKLFTPLFTTKSKGQGFGLAVCKRVIEAMGGTISFESEAGKGTKFIISLST